jgi:hypothetical protein
MLLDNIFTLERFSTFCTLTPIHADRFRMYLPRTFVQLVISFEALVTTTLPLHNSDFLRDSFIYYGDISVTVFSLVF